MAKEASGEMQGQHHEVRKLHAIRLRQAETLIADEQHPRTHGHVPRAFARRCGRRISREHANVHWASICKYAGHLFYVVSCYFLTVVDASQVQDILKFHPIGFVAERNGSTP